jgi:hypothetical protein
MHPIDLDHLRSKTYFDDAVSVLEKLGLTELATLKCNFNPHLIMQFFCHSCDHAQSSEDNEVDVRRASMSSGFL